VSSDTHMPTGAGFVVAVSETFRKTFSPCNERIMHGPDKGEISGSSDDGLRKSVYVIDFANNSDKQALKAIPQFPLIEHRAAYRRD
jgi:hypothetical protein